MKPLALALIAYAALGLAACEDSIDHFDEDDDTNTSSGSTGSGNNVLDVPGCEGVIWRNPSPNRVMCPGAEGCGCDLPTICCATNAVGDASCTTREQCADDVVGCDGPEDCGAGEVCCASSIESSCVAESECGLDRFVLCRSDDDCSLPRDTCVPGDPPAIAACE